MQPARLLFLIAAGLSITAAAARSATISWVSDFRQLESGGMIRRPAAPFADFDETLSSMVAEPGGEPRMESSGSQQSSFRPAMTMITSRVSGDTGRGASYFKVVFILDEVSPFRLTGSFNLLGSAGFACVSLVNLANPGAPVVHEVIFAPPLAAESRKLDFIGTLESGRYSMEAMIYGGGDNQFTQGGIDVIFSVPEPGSASLAFLAALLVTPRKRSPSRENSSSHPTALCHDGACRRRRSSLRAGASAELCWQRC